MMQAGLPAPEATVPAWRSNSPLRVQRGRQVDQERRGLRPTALIGFCSSSEVLTKIHARVQTSDLVGVAVELLGGALLKLPRVAFLTNE